jgi:GNAT superfamily N-acetyltransferase
VRPRADSRIVAAAAARRTMTSSPSEVSSTAIRFATAGDVPTILHFIRSLAHYEKLEHEVVVDEARLHATLFGARPAAEVLLASHGGTVVGFALFFTNYSTFLGKSGIYLEDLFVEPAARGRGVGLALMSALAKIAVDRDYGRFEWAVLDWNAPALEFYRSLGAQPQSEWTVQRVVGEPLAALARRWPGQITST